MTVSEAETVPRVIVLLSEPQSSHKLSHIGIVILFEKINFLTHNASSKKENNFLSEVNQCQF